MGLNPDRIGHTYDAYLYEVSREKVREYVAATGGDPSAFVIDPLVGSLTDPRAGDVPVVPLQFAACFTIGRLEVFLADPELGAHPSLVHNQQRFTAHEPMRVGQVLRCTPKIVDISSRSRMELLTVQIDAADASTGRAVVTSTSTIVFFPEAEGT